MPCLSARTTFWLCLSLYLGSTALSSALAATASDVCPAYLPPVIRISPYLEDPDLDHSKTLDDIGQLAGRKDGTVASGHHEIPVGVTIADLRLGSNYEISISEIEREDGSTFFCAEPAQFELSLEVVNTIVYVAKELPVDTCSYRTISQHEGFHVREDRDIVLETAAALPPYLSHAMRDLGVVKGDTQQDVRRKVTSAVEKIMTAIKTQIVDIRQKRQSAIDSLQEYDRLSKSCNGALRAIIAQSERKKAQRR